MIEKNGSYVNHVPRINVDFAFRPLNSVGHTSFLLTHGRLNGCSVAFLVLFVLLILMLTFSGGIVALSVSFLVAYGRLNWLFCGFLCPLCLLLAHGRL